MLDLEGAVGLGFSPYIASPHWTVVGTSSFPKAHRLTYPDALTGAYDSQWVEMEGVVRSFVQQAEGNVLVMDVATPTGAFKVRVPDYHDAFPMDLVDAKVRFRGVCGSAFNRMNQLVAIHVMMPGLTQLQIVVPPPPDPFAIATSRASDVRRFSADTPDIHRVKVVGTVTARYPGRGLFLMDSSGGLYVETQDGTPVEVGDELEVIGFPALGNYSPVLKSAILRKTMGHSLTTPAWPSARTMMAGGYDARLVTVTGILRSIHRNAHEYILVLDSEDHVTFEVSLPDNASGPQPVQPGSKLEVTGICSVKTDENGNPSEFQIVTRKHDDIKVLSSPPWLNARLAGLILGALAILTAATLSWVTILRHRVRQQTEVIKQRLKNEMALEERYRQIFERNLTGLYVAKLGGEILDCNDACARILGFADRDHLLRERSRAASTLTQVHAGHSAKSLQQTGTSTEGEHRITRFDGSAGWVLSSVRLAHDTGSNVLEGSLIDVSARKTAEEKVQTLAYFDSLTELPNRTLLKDRLHKAVALAKRQKAKLGVLFLDLDRFKNINDSLGHSYGDLLLQELAHRLQTCAREQDTIARLGGDEFVIVLNSLKAPADAAVSAQRILEVATREFSIQGQALNMTCSIGISIFPDHGEDVEALIKNADVAMYSAKEAGRNTFRFFTEKMNEEAGERLAIENGLRTAIAKQQLFLMYQPELDVLTGRVDCWEALLRWKHPELGLVPPMKFIRIAENNGTIVQIGEWVLRTACSQVQRWHKEGIIDAPVAVNVSAVQFRQDGFTDLVRNILRETELKPELLELELTESLLLWNEDVVFEVLGELHRMGVRLAIDDFGTGYSSLSYLKQFPVHKLKIDRSFIRDIAQNNNDSAITAAIIQMAKCLKLKVTAEGVESDAQLSLLRDYRCDEVQGYLFSRPLTSDEVLANLRLKRGEERLTAIDRSTSRR